MGVITTIINSFSILPLEKKDLEKASLMKWGDFEDAVLSTIAHRYKIDYIVAYDEKHFVDSMVPSLSPTLCFEKCVLKKP